MICLFLPGRGPRGPGLFRSPRSLPSLVVHFVPTRDQVLQIPLAWHPTFYQTRKGLPSPLVFLIFDGNDAKIESISTSKNF